MYTKNLKLEYVKVNFVKGNNCTKLQYLKSKASYILTLNYNCTFLGIL